MNAVSSTCDNNSRLTVGAAMLSFVLIQSNVMSRHQSASSVIV